MEETETVREASQTPVQESVQVQSEADIIKEEMNKYLTEMDKVFIPEDLDANIDMTELVQFQKAKLFKVVPPNYALVTKNIFTQKIKCKLVKKAKKMQEIRVPEKDEAGNDVLDEEGNVKYVTKKEKVEVERPIRTEGLKFVVPFFTKTIMVPKQNGVMKFTATELTANNEEITATIGVVMRITDPAKYMYEGKNKAQEIKTRVNGLLKAYVRYSTYESVSKVRDCELNSFDPTNQFGIIEKEYGISIEKVIVERIQLSENLKKVYDDRAEAEKRREAEQINLQLSKEKAAIEAENIRLIADAENYKLMKQGEIENEILKNKVDQMILTMRANGSSSEDISKALNTIFLTNNSRIGEQISDATIAGITAAQVMQNANGRTRS